MILSGNVKNARKPLIIIQIMIIMEAAYFAMFAALIINSFFD